MLCGTSMDTRVVVAVRLSRQHLARQSSALVSQAAKIAVLIVDYQPPVLDGLLDGGMHFADGLAPLLRPPVRELVELPAYKAGQLISRFKLRHAFRPQHPYLARTNAAPPS
jgi:hypothetical protein